MTIKVGDVVVLKNPDKFQAADELRGRRMRVIGVHHVGTNMASAECNWLNGMKLERCAYLFSDLDLELNPSDQQLAGCGYDMDEYRKHVRAEAVGV